MALNNVRSTKKDGKKIIRYKYNDFYEAMPPYVIWRHLVVFRKLKFCF